MPRKHIMIFPGHGVDFLRAERSYDCVWLRSSQSTWLPHLLPAVYQSVEVCDFSFSSFRELPMADPSLMPLPSDTVPYQVLILAPIGDPYHDQWGSLVFYSRSNTPVVASERFVPTNGGVERVVRTFFSQERIDGMRNLDSREHAEIWVRHSLKIHDMLPNAYEAPRWLREQHRMDPETAARKMAALRLPTPASQYHATREQEHARKEATEEEARREQADKDWREAAAALGVPVPDASTSAGPEASPAPQDHANSPEAPHPGTQATTIPGSAS